MYFCQTFDQSSVEEFKKLADDFLYQNEAEYNLIIGLVESQLEKQLITIHQADKKIVGCAIQNSPNNFVITKIPTEALSLLIETINNLGLSIPGVVGPNIPSEEFAKLWSQNKKCQYKMAMDQKLYKLTKIVFPKKAEGIIRLPIEKDYLTLLQFFLDFSVEALGQELHDPERIKINLDRRLTTNQILILENRGEIVGFVGSARPTKNGQCIAPVYTPKKFRGRGYGSNLVAAMSQRILDSGKKFCCLYTDLNNPTSNSIYQKVGYQEIATSRHFIFH